MKLRIVTDAHCHPTDLNLDEEDYYHVPLGGIASMATIPEDQEKVMTLARSYHPWFVHRYTLHDTPPDKSTHYRSLFLSHKPTTTQVQLLDTLLPYLPDPSPFQPLLNGIRAKLERCKKEGKLVMLGEVGLDGQARLRWPPEARHLYVEKSSVEESSNPLNGQTKFDGNEQARRGKDDDKEEEEWKRLTPFKTVLSHQRAILMAQMELAVELGINVSLHSVAAPGPTAEALLALKKKHGKHFTHRINVDLHSAGGWSPSFWTQTAKHLPNLYASPSILITGRSTSAPDLIRSISPDKLLVESDSHDVRLSGRLVWAACVWIASCRSWRLEGSTSPTTGVRGRDETTGSYVFSQSELQSAVKKGADDWTVDPTTPYETDGDEVWTVRQLESNWRRFMRLDE
ncbi:hypothetical protein TREMEDRAFT_66816 [Tremella mesenterica DSM 1558]|uniref:uncharacterized protein n=1 Tax=Tremella mesenterica (strain ATCC 24925 / CBS 8224 / DSM 1558 / NBRC 9311 / NRRL Y-6157 / RJB 2259-6 / UBC 559-6) TaxID=578456 RepID=UPI0003F49496|nr:uncharacterized protein TREMEDRAFT_66816 [Tremella mesenterica DSM 1558]EIW72316.1 hypothetical protein TREMEDRAFT_66816 [Tremella mesenterica DSM 1558]